MKKLLALLLTFSFILCGCSKKETNETTTIEGEITELMDKLYEGIDEEELPSMLSTNVLDEELLPNFIGTNEVQFKEACMSEPMMSSVAHSVVLIRVENTDDIEEIKTLIKENANPRKWICVEAENVYVESNKDLVVLIMANELADPIKSNFEKLK